MNTDYVRVASKAAPIYSVYIANSAGLNITVDAVVTELKLSENERELAQRANIELRNCYSDDYLLSELVNVHDTVFIYANDGDECKEVFRGYVWRKKYRNRQSKIIMLTCYDNLIYMQGSEDSRYYPAGKSTEDVFNDICWSWSIDLRYNYESITHRKLPLSGSISNILKDDLLDKVKKKTGIKYVIRSSEGIMYVERYGSNVNSRVFEINRGENAISTLSDVSMEDVVTKIVFIGKANDDGKSPITGTITGDTEKYGTIQKIIKDDTDKNKEDDGKDKMFESARDEGQYMLDENGKPKEKDEIVAIDIPWIRKGDLVKISAGDLSLRYIVTSVTHDAIKKTMTLNVEVADESKLQGSSPSGSVTPSASRAVELSNAPIYISSDAASPTTHFSGTYYLYDGKEILGRYRICKNSEDVGRKPVNQYVDGWLPKEYC